jgi:hypothetical protein
VWGVWQNLRSKRATLSQELRCAAVEAFTHIINLLQLLLQLLVVRVAAAAAAALQQLLVVLLQGR